MRKRIVIGLVAILGVGVLVYVVSQPKKGSVEWHKTEFRKAQKEMYPGAHQDTFPERIGKLYRNIMNRPGPVPTGGPGNSQLDELYGRYESNRSALVRLGYFRERRFAISNGSPELLCVLLRGGFRDADFTVRTYDYGSDARPAEVVVSAAGKEMAAIERWIRQYEVPESRK